ncbi:MAG: hypothetical protein NT129_06215 [Candidatus Aenigmarchaeota archaeon]|nr:hypothetical protein [Candidatus Aenigmarchaeota archaeon]
MDDPALNELIPGFNEQFYTAQRLMGTRNYLRGIEAARQADSPQEFASWFDAEVVHEYEGPFETSKRALDGARLISEKGLTKLTAYDIEMIENKYTNSRN